MSSAGSTLAVVLLLLVIVVLGVLLYQQIGQRQRLKFWLDDPLNRDIPSADGPWGDLFAKLQRLRKKEEKTRLALDASLERFHKAAQALPDGVILLDAEGHIEWLNQAASDHFGLDPARDAGILIEQFIRQSEFYTFYSRFRAGENSPPLLMTVGMEGSRRALSMLLLSFADTGILLLSRDISDISRAETMRRDFIANVSHELRTPLTVISGFMEHLTADDAATDDAIKGILNLIAEQAQRMSRLVEDLLTLSRLENAAEPPREEDIDVADLLHTLYGEAQALSSGRHDIVLDPVEPCRLRGSSNEIRSAFGNLVTNAIRYTPAGGRIALSWKDVGDSLIFTVTDSGIGIGPEHIPRLTERFYRVDKGRSTNTGGTGLGLAIVKHVLARHQGSLNISSRVGQGSRFSAILPALRRSAEKPEPHPEA
jgi:two-component system phosphate regulon sensor histidine kinase PhoR